MSLSIKSLRKRLVLRLLFHFCFLTFATHACWPCLNVTLGCWEQNGNIKWSMSNSSYKYNSITTSFSITSEVVFFATLYISAKSIAKSYRKSNCANAWVYLSYVATPPKAVCQHLKIIFLVAEMLMLCTCIIRQLVIIKL